MSAGFSIRSAGYWLEAIAPYGEVQTTWRWAEDGGGLDQIEWRMDLPYDFDHPALRRGARVELMDGAQRVGQAILGEPGRTETGKSFSAAGLYRSAERFLCLTGTGETTTTPDVAIDEAAADGCPLTRSGSLSAAPLKTDDVTDGLNYLNVLLTALAVETGEWWHVDADGAVQLDPAPTVPTWHLVPGVADPGTADDEYASTLFGRYQRVTDEVQVVTITGAPTGGTFTLIFDGQTTAAIEYNATAAAVQAALVALSNIGPTDVSVTGAAGGPYTVTFQAGLAGQDVPQLTSTPSLTGGSSPTVTHSTTTPGGVNTLATATVEDAAAAARWGIAQYGLDLTGLGTMTQARAASRLNGLLTRGRSRLTFTDRLEVDSNQLLTAGGRPASLSLVRAGQLVRAHGLHAYSQWLNGNPWLDFVIGEAVWANGADTITLAPVGLAARTWEDLLAQTARASLKP